MDRHPEVIAGTYALRVSMFVLLGESGLPSWAERPMNVVGPAAIAALVATMTFTQRGTIQAPTFTEAGALVLGFVAVRRTGNVMAAFGVGLPAFWVLSSLV